MRIKPSLSSPFYSSHPYRHVDQRQSSKAFQKILSNTLSRKKEDDDSKLESRAELSQNQIQIQISTMISHVKGPFPVSPPALPHPNWNSAVVRFTAPLALTRATRRIATTAAAILAAASLIASPVPSAAAESSSSMSEQQDESTSTLSNIPQTLSGECAQPSDCKKARIQRPKSRKAESCTIKCVGTCIRGGDGSPGEGPLNIRRPLIVFKQGFRSRQYCLVECSDICNLIGDGDDGP